MVVIVVIIIIATTTTSEAGFCPAPESKTWRHSVKPREVKHRENQQNKCQNTSPAWAAVQNQKVALDKSQSNQAMHTYKARNKNRA